MSDGSTGIDGIEADGSAVGEAGWGESDALPVDEVRELFVTLGKALRAYQLYDENNPVYQRFVTALADAFRGLWPELDHVTVKVTEDTLYFGETDVYRSDSRADSLAFLFFKDGIREISFLPGIEGEELTRFLSVLQGARVAKPESDDLITVLWERDLQFFRYHHVNVLAEGVVMPEAGPGNSELDFQNVLSGEMGDGAEGAEGEEEASEAGGHGAPEDAEKKGLTIDDFNPTLYSLSPKEMEELRAELEKEMYRDMRASVLAALFDRLEEPEHRERQSEILEIFRQLMPNLLSRGAISVASAMLQQLVALERDGQIFDEQREQEVRSIVAELSAPETIGELVLALEDGSIRPNPEELGRFLSYLDGTALAPLVRAAEVSQVVEVRPVIRKAIEGMAARDHEAVVALFDDPDPGVVAGAARIVGQMKISEAAGRLGTLMGDSSPSVRLAAVDAARELRASAAAGALTAVIHDDDSRVRIAAAEALGALQYQPAKAHLQDVITGKAIRDADLNERIAFFEGFGRVARDGGTSLLDKMLNGKGFLGRREPSEIRACAAIGLGAIGSPNAMAALRQAVDDADPVVRSAVGRSLRLEGQS